MIVYPAIDLKDGSCVRLVQGDMGRVTVFNDDPTDQAGRFAAAGFAWLHLVDLNGALEGTPINAAAVEAVLAAVNLPVQLGGGIRDMATIEMWLSKGVRRVVLGTVALANPELVRSACRRFPGRIVVGIDARHGMVATRGWTETSETSALDLALRFEDAGVAAIVFTDIARDGALGGVNIDATVDLAWALTTPVIASGGVADHDDLRAIYAERASGIDGVICGRALYDGRIDPATALSIAAGREC
ncbi:MAG: 1-(5-phosphoribosyl)-5-[(5-phosphoribosylamino)methylideneamino]imidazole-4-carboxamide isomerase [Alphaproteobacteria bacterium]|nr:1-(5-phosphoribosyl)-5-[(5-phosphoribosylamino)methylideneamino]imidazole-4-carboxamide isomerase [Alphaproteobacteria bacterium]MCY4320411.1 1-(5-phosphoribosyl)-5-[(5-phosphoribosylamino)methylideneamino]imidazole-4-carboxamide isomerase [Alphaproteobacteria bacterium]